MIDFGKFGQQVGMLSPYAPKRPDREPTEVGAVASTAAPVLAPIDHIAALMASLTYGEMLDFAKALKGDAAEITRESLPDLLHRWAMDHGKPAEASAP